MVGEGRLSSTICSEGLIFQTLHPASHLDRSRRLRPGCGRQPRMERDVVAPQGSWRRRERAVVEALRHRIPVSPSLSRAKS